MKVLYPDQVLALCVQNANAEFPKSFLRDDYPKRKWRGTGSSAWIRALCDARSSAVGIAWTNAKQIDIAVHPLRSSGTTTSTSTGKLVDASATFITNGVTAGDVVINSTDETSTTVSSVDSQTQLTLADDIFTTGESYVIEHPTATESTTYYIEDATTYYEFITGVQNQYRDVIGTTVLYEYTYQYFPHIIEITLQALPGETIECGILRAGMVMTFPDPLYGIKEGLRDTSIIKELNNGARYVRKRDIVRTFDMQVVMKRDRDFYTIMRDFVRINGVKPTFWKTASIATTDWSVFGALSGMPDGTHSYPEYSEISMRIEEAI